MLRSLAQIGSGPAQVLSRLNEMLLEDFPDGRFVTMVYAELDPQKRTLRLANAGHLSPLLVDFAEPGGHRWIQSEQGLPLGIADSKFSETEIKLTPGARVAFYSDGITEAELESGEEYGPERLLAQLQSPNFYPEALLADVKTFVNGAGLRDDATVILVSARKRIGPERIELEESVFLSKSCAVLFQNAQIHHDEHPRLPRPFRRAFIDHIFLEPDRRNLKLNCLLHNLIHKLRPPENIHQVDLLRQVSGHVEQGRIRLLPQRLRNLRIDGDDPVALRLHIRRHTMARRHRTIRQPDHRNRFRGR